MPGRRQAIDCIWGAPPDPCGRSPPLTEPAVNTGTPSPPTTFPLDAGLLFESHPLPMWVYDVETLRFLAVNDAALRRYGYTRDEFLQLTITDIHPPEDAGLGERAEVAGPRREAPGRPGHDGRRLLRSGSGRQDHLRQRRPGAAPRLSAGRAHRQGP